MKTIKHFKILFFNVDKKNRFILKQFKQNPSNELEFLNSLISFEGFNVTNELFINSFYKKYLDIFTEVTKKLPNDYDKHYWGTNCLNINYKSSTNEYFKSRGFSHEEMIQIRKKKYATGTIEFQTKKHKISQEDAKHKLDNSQQIIKKNRQETYKKYLENNPNYWKETVGYGVESLMKNKGLSLEEATELCHNISTSVSEKNKQWASTQRTDNPEYWNSRLENQPRYWINRGYSEEAAIERVKERQTTFTLEKCIEKYGKDEGTIVYNERQEKWSNKIEEMYRNGEFTKFCKSNWSKSEINFIQDVVKCGNLKDTEYYSAVNGNQFFRHFKEIGRTFAYDFVLGKKIIEFNGDYWHMNPDNYDENDFNKSIQETASEKWKSDALKNNMIESHGYEVLTVWESEYHKNPKETIQKCINFINN